MTAPATQLVQIEKPVYGGAFLARVDGKAIFVPLTLPGEQARVRIMQDKRGYANAEAEEIVVPAPERVAPVCRHFGSCGGCSYQHTNYETQLALKQAILRETLQRGGVRVPDKIAVLAAEPWGYRNRIRLAFDAQGNPGYRGRRSHSIVPISECPIAAPLLLAAGNAVADIARSSTPAQRPSEISLFCDAAQRSLLVTSVIANPAKARAEDFAHSLSQQIPELIGAEFVTEGLAGRQPRTVARWGVNSLTYHAAGFDYRVDHGAFFQVNRWLLDPLVERVTSAYSGSLAWDLFAGVGLFARQLTATFNRVVAVESALAAIAALEQNLDGTTGAAVKADTLAFLRHSSENNRPDLIVVDPPRTGLGVEITTLLADVAAPYMVYVSCDPATLARDLKALADGGYATESITLADLFPQTSHLETIVELRRA
ncbi:MAG: 23S rRNA (uracil(1939)-C(5))-methyltransferase RlmD [Terracidiphilus sp.]